MLAAVKPVRPPPIIATSIKSVVEMVMIKVKVWDSGEEVMDWRR